MKMKAQMLFENFIVGFLFLFILASSIFLFIGEGIDIDLFNRTIFSEPVTGLDYLYMSAYVGGDVNNIDLNQFEFIETPELTITFNVTRTFMPPSSSSPVEVVFYVIWPYCPTVYVDDCEVRSNEPGSVDRILNSRKLQTYTYTFILPSDEVYTDCSTDLIIGAVIESSVLNETIFDNNFYTLNIPYCFFPPTDVSITAGCVPSSDDPGIACTTQRSWDNTLIYGGEFC